MVHYSHTVFHMNHSSYQKKLVPAHVHGSQQPRNIQEPKGLKTWGSFPLKTWGFHSMRFGCKMMIVDVMHFTYTLHVNVHVHVYCQCIYSCKNTHVYIYIYVYIYICIHTRTHRNTNTWAYTNTHLHSIYNTHWFAESIGCVGTTYQMCVHASMEWIGKP